MENKAINVSRKDLFAAHNNFIKDNKLKFDEIGMIAYMLYCSKLDLDFTPERAAADRKMDTSEVNAILTSLNKKGYFCQVKLLDNNGDFVDWLYRISDTYHPEWIGVDPFEFVK